MKLTAKVICNLALKIMKDHEDKNDLGSDITI